MQALFKARSLPSDSENGEIFSRIVDFATKADSLGGDNAAVKEVIRSEIAALLNGATLSEFVSKAAGKVKTGHASLPFRVAVAKAQVQTKTASVSEAATFFVNGGLGGRGVNVSTCHDALAALQGFGKEADQAVTEWTEKVNVRFPLMKK